MRALHSEASRVARAVHGSRAVVRWSRVLGSRGGHRAVVSVDGRVVEEVSVPGTQSEAFGELATTMKAKLERALRGAIS
jgi:hypothetical protein